MVGFAELEFDHEEDNVYNNAIMLDKQYKILNSKLNTIIQFLNDIAGNSSMRVEVVEFMLKTQSHKQGILLIMMLQVWKNVLLINLVLTNMQSRTYKLLLVSDMKFFRSLWTLRKSPLNWSSRILLICFQKKWQSWINFV